MAPKAGTGERYATQVGELWSGLAGTLSRLEALAGEPDRLEDEDELDDLRRLQYSLHVASEHAYGLAPPAGTEPVHTELAAALVGARDATAQILEAIDGGGDPAGPLVYLWRGALFRVRLARLRLAEKSRPATSAEPVARPSLKAPLAAVALVFSGATLFVAGATIGPWLVWVAGLVAVCASLIAFKP